MANQQTTPATATAAAERLPCFDSASVLELLMDRAAANLSRPELQWLAENGQECARQLAANGAQVFEGVGCLVMADGESSARMGAFQSFHDVPPLAFHVSALLSQIEGLLHVAILAADQLEP